MPSSGTAEVTLPSDTEVLIRRAFDAPKHLVYLRVGGRWRSVMTTNEGFEVAFNGVYREIVPNERIVNTEVYEAMPEGEALVTVTFTEADGRTTLSMLTDMGSKEARDGMIASGMETGVQEGMDILERIAIELGEAEG